VYNYLCSKTDCQAVRQLNLEHRTKKKTDACCLRNVKNKFSLTRNYRRERDTLNLEEPLRDSPPFFVVFAVDLHVFVDRLFHVRDFYSSTTLNM